MQSYQDQLHARFEAEYQQHLEEGSALMSGKISLVAALVLAHYIDGSRVWRTGGWVSNTLAGCCC